MIIRGQHRPKAGVECLYAPRKQGGRGLMKIEEADMLEVMKLMEYAEGNEDSLI